MTINVNQSDTTVLYCTLVLLWFGSFKFRGVSKKMKTVMYLVLARAISNSKTLESHEKSKYNMHLV
jgi:hypothetical protein